MITDYYIDQSDALYKEQDSIYHKAAADFGLADSTLCILYMLLFASGDMTQQELCRRCCYPKQTVNSTVSNLKKNGYVMLEPMPEARNTKRILLTAAGRELAERTALRLRQAESLAYSSFSEDELETFIRLSAKLNAALRKEFAALAP